MTDHLWHDVDEIEYLAVVDSHVAVNHLRDDQHIAQVGLDSDRLVKGATG